MPRNTSSASVGEMLDDLKSRLGFNRAGDNRRDDDFGAYDDFDEYGDYNEEFAEYGRDYNADEPVGGYQPTQVRTSRTSRFGRADSTPNLVSIGDVKASTPLPDLDDPLPPLDSYSTTRVGARNVIDNTMPAPSSPAYNAAVREAAGSAASGGTTLAGAVSPVSATSAASAYDPYEAYSSANPSTYAKTRSFNVIRPISYGDVERVARAVKTGDVVVLVLRATPDDLSKRLLDFSFGVASALDANVECPAEKVFAIARGEALSDDEKQRLRLQGIL